MIFHGVAKLTNLSGIQKMVGEAGFPEMMAYGVYITGLIAPLLILIGWRTRLVSIVFFFGMLCALFLAHSNSIFELSKSGALAIELILLFAMPAVALFFTGAGKYAISTKNKWD